MKQYAVKYTVRAMWDDEAEVWVASSENVPGLITEAATMEMLIQKLKIMIPELLDANGVMPLNIPNIPFHLYSERTETIVISAVE